MSWLAKKAIPIKDYNSKSKVLPASPRSAVKQTNATFGENQNNNNFSDFAHLCPIQSCRISRT
jgi:hypothetical protein